MARAADFYSVCRRFKSDRGHIDVRSGCGHTFLPPRRVAPPIPFMPRAGRPASPTRKRPVEVRKCRVHGQVEFANYRNGSRTVWRCKKCCADAVTRRHQKVRGILIEEAGGRCSICGYDRCTANLHFHHVQPELKSFNMDMGRGKSLAAYQAEARKCVLVCANCHGEIESGVVPSPPVDARFGEEWKPTPDSRPKSPPPAPAPSVEYPRLFPKG